MARSVGERIKDWEAPEFSHTPEHWVDEYEKRKSNRAEYNTNGLISIGGDWSEYNFTSEMEKKDSIQRDLNDEVFTENPGRTVYVMHAPPYDTCLDIISPGKNTRKHVGSMAVRQFIMDNSPCLTLHGHIHESVELSGSFMDKVGTTPCMSPGNTNYTRTIVVLVFDVYNVDGVKRLEF